MRAPRTLKPYESLAKTQKAKRKRKAVEEIQEVVKRNKIPLKVALPSLTLTSPTDLINISKAHHRHSTRAVQR